ncbi:tRNA dihydrouridine synthase DusB [Roseibacillus ishigakijimensis]|uniref:tRNA-dihydrouridine synthase n=1 Tax=Roseibacillus ishigakijimensis TaxID=454146 RepID=A0A934RK39_9BACT|nr:tRNA dihydrouridine synthase DusB [Roseibacillus ishigakijimensis]MBK1833167.1 tRNA dihydrouridine synthase DusB [Roseibacillus ishigakijimensis]
MLPWFADNQFPLFLAPMAGVTDVTFRTICKELGADVMVTEFVSAEGIMQADQRTRKYTEFTDEQRPVGVQLFGADGVRMGEAANKIIDWKRPDFIDINFGCPVNKVVSKNGGSSLLKDCPLLAATARGIVKAVGHRVPVTAKIRVGWDFDSINAEEVCRILEGEGIQSIAIHGRTRSQGYSGEANWEVIDQAARAVKVPVIGNGDLTSGEVIARRKEETAVSGLMIGRAAMQTPWIFREAKHYLATGETLPPLSVEERWPLILRHCRLAIQSDRYGDERHTMMAMRSRLMAYCKGFPGSKALRRALSQVESVAQLEDLAESHLSGKFFQN